MICQLSYQDGLATRRLLLDKARRVVVKVGSAILTDEDGMNLPLVERLVDSLLFLRQSGREVILVSSGAVAAGRRRIRLTQEDGIREKQALAAIGQSILMHTYDRFFSRRDTTIAQVLLTHDDLDHRHRYLNIRNTLTTLLRFGAVPIINENDTVSVEELRFGDNDRLAALITNLTEADLSICLTDVAGLYPAPPDQLENPSPIANIVEINEEIEKMLGESVSGVGTGGMATKVRAAKMVAARGGASFIGPGREERVIERLFAGEDVGSFFFPAKHPLHSRKHWIAYTLKPKGELILDDGACAALTKKGRSLLPSGIIEVRGDFGPGDAVRCLDKNNRPVAVGLINYAAADTKRIQGAHSDQIATLLGYKDSDELMHRDNLVLL
ncbi:MAG: glutamate 5-kinase [Desulfobulbaceae bacterium]|jgi:glutamate 5-kinase|nr:glutamate 5-kinase [Desulfobulbaceae bacterium]